MGEGECAKRDCVFVSADEKLLPILVPPPPNFFAEPRYISNIVLVTNDRAD